ncbi:MAG: hypothetical protein WBC44_08505 [Planctomycetaceae bacterium]
MTKRELIDEVKEVFKTRKSTAGLCLAFIDFLRELDAVPKRFRDLNAFFQAFPQEVRTASNKQAITLIVSRGSGRTLSIRPFYNRREKAFYEQGRYSYPSMAPHATQAWGEYRHWIETLLRLTNRELDEVEKSVFDFVLGELKDQRVDPDSLTPLQRPFYDLLSRFDFSTGRTGAAFQGASFAFLRADNPQIQLDVKRVRTGGRRVGRIGDIDGYSGRRLILSGEAKHRSLEAGDVSDFARFRDEVARHRASGIILAQNFTEEARQRFQDEGLRCLSLDDLIRQAELWDPIKQRAAIDAFEFYCYHVERDADLISRFEEFSAEESTE